MKLNNANSLPAFLQAVDQCLGDVIFRTPEGDVLNLKSQLSKYVFLAAAASPQLHLISEGEVICSDPADEVRLEGFARQ